MQKECHSSMLYEYMKIYHLMMHAKHMEEERDKSKSRDSKRIRSLDRGRSKNRLEIQDKPRFKKRVSNHVPSKFHKAPDDKVSKPIFQKGRSGNIRNEKPTCAKCAYGHFGKCLVGTGNCFCWARVAIRLGIALI